MTVPRSVHLTGINSPEQYIMAIVAVEAGRTAAGDDGRSFALLAEAGRIWG